VDAEQNWDYEPFEIIVGRNGKFARDGQRSNEDPCCNNMHKNLSMFIAGDAGAVYLDGETIPRLVVDDFWLI